jgi:AAA+ ATPase superfamily predicted ATPase
MEEMQNPFVYGSVVTGPDFVGRESEIRDLRTSIRNGKSTVIYSDRKMGKSSLLAEFMRRYDDDLIFVYLDTYGITGLNEFLEKFAEEVTRHSLSKVRRFASSFLETIKGTGLRVIMTEEGEVGVELTSARPRQHEIDEVFELPEKIAKLSRKKMVVIIDEFQDVASVGGVQLIKTMRSKFQWHKNAVYVFSGSKRHMLMSIFEEHEGAFYKFARPMALSTIPTDEFKGYLVQKYSSAGGSLSDEVATRVVEAGGGYPYYVQHVAYELFQISMSPTLDDVDAAIQSTVDHQSSAFMNIWESVRSLLHRRYLLAIASEPGVPQGVAFIERHALRSPSHVSRIRTQLEKRGLTEKGRIVDPFFARWLRTANLRNGQE